ncbi:MAG: nuclear transport factor 2 family protein [Bacteroidia bacterium]|nr:nuclear transport factor 2 family protein [Bacteroidia bacterium]
MRTTLFVILTFSAIAHAQIDKNSELFITLKKQDSAFFERGFNQCDFDFLDESIADELKFYHDKSGIQNRTQFFENTKKYICSNSDLKPIRKLKEGSLVVYPLYNNGVLYGAIQNGIHNFYIRAKGKDDIWTSSAKFTHVWLLENDKWKLSEVLSFDHKDPNSKH